MKNLIGIILMTLAAVGCSSPEVRSANSNSYSVSTKTISGTETEYIVLKFGSSQVEHYVFRIDSSGVPTLNELSSKCVPYGYRSWSPIPEIYFYDNNAMTTVIGLGDDGSFYADESVDSSIAPLTGTVVRFDGQSLEQFNSLVNSATPGTTVARCTPQ